MDCRLGVMHDRRQHGGGISKPPPAAAAKGKKAAARNSRQQNCGMRVVYIASPMKLTASPEEFRAVVQELTGRHSNIADRQYVDSINHQYHPPPRASINVVSATAGVAPPPPVSSAVLASSPAPAPPLPRQMFLQSYGHGEHEQVAGNMCYGQGYYW